MAEQVQNPDQQPQYFDEFVGPETIQNPLEIPVESRLAADDPIHQRLQAAGMMGEPVMKFSAGNQHFAVIDVSKVGRDGIGSFAPFAEGHAPVGNYPRTFEPVAEDVPTLALVHFEGNKVAARALRPFSVASMGRNVTHKDKKANRFSYGDDLTISRDHVDLVLDPTTRTLQLRSNSQKNPTAVRYEMLTHDEAVARRGEPVAHAEVGAPAVAAVVVPESAAHHNRFDREQGMTLGDELERSLLGLQTKGELTREETTFLEEMVGSGSQAIQGLLERSVTQLPTSGESRMNIRQLITAARNILELNDGREEAAAFTRAHELGQVSADTLIKLMDRMAVQRFNVPKAVRGNQRVPFEDYARSLSILIKDLADVNNGLPVTPHIETKIEDIIVAQDDAERSAAEVQQA